MQWINRSLVQVTRKTAPPNGYRRKPDCLSFQTMLDLLVVSVEKTCIISSFPLITLAKFAPAIRGRP